MAIQVSEKNIGNDKLNDASVSDAITQFKEASARIYDAVSSISNATANNAKACLHEGKTRAIELEEKAEKVVKARPLVTLGVAFAAGWFISYLLRNDH